MANIPAHPRLSRPINYISRMFSSSELTGASSRKIGDIEILNGDGGLDHLLADYIWDEKQVEVFVGSKDWEFDQFKKILAAKIKDLVWDEDKINVKMHDSKKLLEDSFQPAKYLGTGGEEGGEELTGVSKPLLYGKCLNVEPVLIDSVNLIYQVHAGPIVSIINVYFAGLQAEPEFYTVDLDAGTFQLLTQPGGKVTCDVRGAIGSAGNTAAVFRHIVEDNSALSWPDSFYTKSFNTFYKYNDLENGVYIRNSSTSIKGVLDDLMASVNGYWYFDRLDRLRIGIIGVAGSVKSVGENKTASIKRTTTPGPVWRISVNYQKNHTIMTGDAVGGSASAERQAFLQAEYRTASAEDTAVQDLYTDRELIIDTNLQSLQAAQDQANRRLEFFGSHYSNYQIEVPILTFDYDIGDGLILTNSRFGLDAATMFLITEINENARTGTMRLSLWGKSIISNSLPDGTYIIAPLTGAYIVTPVTDTYVRAP